MRVKRRTDGPQVKETDAATQAFERANLIEVKVFERMKLDLGSGIAEITVVDLQPKSTTRYF